MCVWVLDSVSVWNLDWVWNWQIVRLYVGPDVHSNQIAKNEQMIRDNSACESIYRRMREENGEKQ